MHLYSCIESKSHVFYSDKIEINYAPIKSTYKIKGVEKNFISHNDLLKKYYAKPDNILFMRKEIPSPDFNIYFIRSTFFNNFSYLQIKYHNIIKTCRIKNDCKLNGERKIFQKQSFKIIFAEPKFSIADIFRRAKPNKNYEEIKIKPSGNNPLDLSIIEGPFFHIFSIVNIIKGTRWPSIPKSKENIAKVLDGQFVEISNPYVLYDLREFAQIFFDDFSYAHELKIERGEPKNFIFNPKSKYKTENPVFMIFIDRVKKNGNSPFHQFAEKLREHRKINDPDFFMQFFNREYSLENNEYKKWLIEFLSLKFSDFFAGGKLVEKFSLFSFSNILFLEVEKFSSSIENIQYNLNKILSKYELEIARTLQFLYVYDSNNYIYREGRRLKYRLSFKIPKYFMHYAFGLRRGDVLKFFAQHEKNTQMITIYEFITGEYIVNKMFNQLPYEFSEESSVRYCTHCQFMNFYRNVIRWCVKCSKKF